MCCALFHGLFWQFKNWYLSKWPSVGPQGTYEYHLHHEQLTRWIKWRTCNVREAKEELENELWCKWSNRRVAKLILQPLRHFTYVAANSPTLQSLYLHHSSFSNPSVASPTSQFILQPFFCFSYVTSSSLNSPGEPPMLQYWMIHIIRSVFNIEH